MGCNALSYSFLDIINEIAERHNVSIKIYIFYQGDTFDASFLCSPMISVFPAEYNPRSLGSIRRVVKRLKTCDLCFDFTAGDSFSDIYGLKGFVKSTIFKLLTIHYSKKFVLGPQTYGPYNHLFARFLAKQVILKSNYVCSRDYISAKVVKALCGRDIDVFTDVAFALPYTPGNLIKNDKIKVGVNVSGLLWNGGYKGDNQFNLRMNYRDYIYTLFDNLANDSRFQLFLIPHVIILNTGSIENDYTASIELIKKYPSCSISPNFTTPIKAKSFISNMDIFIGSRMHATIAAFSSEVVTIPISYSRKFEGLYNSIGYEYSINARDLTTEQAIDKTINYIENKIELINCQTKSIQIVETALLAFKQKCEGIILNSSHRS